MGGKDCDDLLHELADLLHGELPDDKRSTLQQHLDDCPPCMERADFQAQLRDLIAKRCCEEVPTDFKQRIAALLEAGGSTSQEPIS
jgi:anti-sigma factor (TIGR02949 family)